MIINAFFNISLLSLNCFLLCSLLFFFHSEIFFFSASNLNCWCNRISIGQSLSIASLIIRIKLICLFAIHICSISSCLRTVNLHLSLLIFHPVFSILIILGEILNTFHTLHIWVENHNLIRSFVVGIKVIDFTKIMTLEQLLILLSKQRNAYSFVVSLELLNLLLFNNFQLFLSFISSFTNDLLFLSSCLLFLTSDVEGFFFENDFALLVDIHV